MEITLVARWLLRDAGCREILEFEHLISLVAEEGLEPPTRGL
jgi:hypothetical protein